MSDCAYSHWWFLPLELRRRLRTLPAYQWNPNRSRHLSDAPPRCTTCRHNLKETA